MKSTSVLDSFSILPQIPLPVCGPRPEHIHYDRTCESLKAHHKFMHSFEKNSWAL